MSFKDWQDNLKDIYKDYYYDQKNKRWTGQIIVYKGFRKIFKTEGHLREEEAREVIEPEFEKLLEELRNGRKVEDLQSL